MLRQPGSGWSSIIIMNGLANSSIIIMNIEEHSVHKLLMYVYLRESNVEDDDWNLICMAVTRAQRTLFMTKTITNILARAGVSALFCLSL